MTTCFPVMALGSNLINLTPLIDVVFVVLISFIVIAPLLEVENINLASSLKTKTEKIISHSNISIKVKEDNSIIIDNKLVTLLELEKILKEKKSLNKNQIPKLYHDKNAAFGTYQSIKNMLENLGFEQVDLVLQPNQIL